MSFYRCLSTRPGGLPLTSTYVVLDRQTRHNGYPSDVPSNATTLSVVS